MSLYSGMVRNVFVPMVLWRRGEHRQLKYQREFERSQYLDTDSLRELQFRRLRTLLHHAYDHCPYYRRHFRDLGLHPADITQLEHLRYLPVLEKQDIQTSHQDMIAENWPTADLIRNQTGGSTGTPVVFYLCKDRKCSRAAATLRHNRWAGWNVGDSAAVIWGAPRDKPSTSVRSRISQLLLAEPLWLDTAELTERTLVGFHEALCRTRPQILQAYAKSAVLFARWLESQKRSLPYRPKSIITTAEVLEFEERALLERVFGCRVFNRYGCREVSVIASECDAHQGMHVMAEGLYLEIETPTGPAKPGEVGSILVTDLLNPAMPMIRYRIGDMGSWASGRCSCGRHLPRLEKLSGRVTEFLVGGDGRLVSGVYLATYVVAQRPSLGQVQIYQERVGHVVYRCCPGPGFNLSADTEYLLRATKEHLGATTSAVVEPVRELHRAASGKFVFSCSTVSPTWLTKGKG